MKYIVFSISLGSCFLLLGVSHAQERGIGVSPSEIVVGQNVEWPYTVSITVTNFSAETENFELLFEKESGVVVSATPGRFSLDAGVSRRVLVTFEEPRHAVHGVIKVLSMKESVEGFHTGMGMKIPFRIDHEDSSRFLAAASSFGGLPVSPQVFGALAVLMTLCFIWYFSAYARKFFRV